MCGRLGSKSTVQQKSLNERDCPAQLQCAKTEGNGVCKAPVAQHNTNATCGGVESTSTEK